MFKGEELTFQFRQSHPKNRNSKMVRKAPEIKQEVDTKVMTFALKFLNTATKDKLMDHLEIPEAVVNKIIDQRDFGGYKTLAEVFDKKLMRKKKFVVFQDKLLAFAKNHKPAEKNDDEPANVPGKKAKSKKGSNAGSQSAEALLALQHKEKVVFKETNPLSFRFGYLLPAPKVEPLVDEPIQPALEVA